MVQYFIIFSVLISYKLPNILALPEMIAIREPQGMVFEGPLQKEPQLIAPMPHLQRKAEKAMKRREEEKRDLSSIENTAVVPDAPSASVDKSTFVPSSPSSFCAVNRKQYENYCMDFFADIPAASRDQILRFCPTYENRCIHH